MRIFGIVVLVSVFFSSGICFAGGGEAHEYCVTAPNLKPDYQVLADTLESVSLSMRPIKALQQEGMFVSDQILAGMRRFGIFAQPLWAARGVLVSLTSSHRELLLREFPEWQFEELSQRAQAVTDQIDHSSRAQPPAIFPYSWNLAMSGASQLKNARSLTGKGVIIGVLAVDLPYDHPSLTHRVLTVKRFGAAATPSPDPVVGRGPSDDLSLMHPLGILSGTHPEMEMGIAPDCEIALALVPRGSITSGDVCSALQWLMEPLEGRRPVAILLCVDFQSMVPKVIRQTVRSLRTAGVLPIVPAGNVSARITGMAALEDCLTVGALDQWKGSALFSGQGPCMEGPVTIIKPDLAEPGVSIFGPSLDARYKYGSGTLQAAAHFAGIWAQLREARPEDDNEAMLTALTSTTQDLGAPGKDNKTGFGLFNPLSALMYLENPPPPPSFPY
jgi:hypothetical protein